MVAYDLGQCYSIQKIALFFVHKKYFRHDIMAKM